MAPFAPDTVIVNVVTEEVPVHPTVVGAALIVSDVAVLTAPVWATEQALWFSGVPVGETVAPQTLAPGPVQVSVPREIPREKLAEPYAVQMTEAEIVPAVAQVAVEEPVAAGSAVPFRVTPVK
jgi:hypothetical protein